MPSRPPKARDVFINCPFDDAYRPLFNAAVFTIAACGFTPRCALEVDNSGQVRFEKIIALIGACPLGVHDLSRTDLSSAGSLPRFNMPLELGLFLGAMRFGNARHRAKRALIMDTKRSRYRDFISDLAGHDIKAHHGTTDGAIRCLREFLAADSSHGTPGAKLIRRWFEQFERQLPANLSSLSIEPHEITFVERRRIIHDWLRATAPSFAPR